MGLFMSINHAIALLSLYLCVVYVLPLVRALHTPIDPIRSLLFPTSVDNPNANSSALPLFYSTAVNAVSWSPNSNALASVGKSKRCIIYSDS